MTAEWVTAAASAGTFLVIAASAVAAVVQLRHVRNSNQIAVLSEIRHKLESPKFQETFKYIRYEVPEKMDDPAVRRRLMDRSTGEGESISAVLNFLDSGLAPLVKHGMVDRELACDLFYTQTVTCWDNLAPLIASLRARLGYRVWEDFEFFALLCKQFRERHPSGTYPKSAPALPLPPPWPEARQGLDRTIAQPAPSATAPPTGV